MTDFCEEWRLPSNSGYTEIKGYLDNFSGDCPDHLIFTFRLQVVTPTFDAPLREVGMVKRKSELLKVVCPYQQLKDMLEKLGKFNIFEEECTFRLGLDQGKGIKLYFGPHNDLVREVSKTGCVFKYFDDDGEEQQIKFNIDQTCLREFVETLSTIIIPRVKSNIH